MIELVGDQEIIRSLGSVAGSIRDPGAFLSEVAVEVAGSARAVAPKRTGRLAASIGVRKFRSGYVVRTGVTYAQYVHYGSIHNPSPVPFMDIATGREAPAARESAERHVDAAIEAAGL